MRLSVVLLLSLLVVAPLHATITTTVTNTNDSGPGSLRQAIVDVNHNQGGTINFAIGSGPKTIQPLTGLPRADYPTTIDGRTQPGFDGDPIIIIDGSFAPSSDSGLAAIGGTIHSFVITNFGGAGISSQGATVLNCIVGPGINGTPQGRQMYTGIEGYGHYEGNLVSGAYLANIFPYGGATIVNNRIGTDITGNANFPVKTSIGILGGSNCVIDGNVIGNASTGILLRYAGNYEIRNNRFGVGRSGGNIGMYYGVVAEEASGGPITGNTFANNDVAVGISKDSLRNVILGNTFKNNGINIDLSKTSSYNDGPTPNDDGDSDLGGNNLLNYPTITRVTSFGGSTTVEAFLAAAPNREYTIELYLGSTCGEAHSPQSLTVTTDANGIGVFSPTYLVTPPPGSVISGVASSTLEGTSEFSPCVEVEGAGKLAFQSSTFSLTEGMPGSLTVTRTGGAFGEATVQYAAANGTASGSDYTLASGTLHFADGETSKTIAFTALIDGVSEGSETFTVTLSSATRAELGTPATITVTIHDADAAPSVSVPSPITVTEGDSGTTDVTVPFELSGTSAEKLSLTYLTMANTAVPVEDYTHAQGTVTFQPGQTQQSITLHITGDTDYENVETFILKWTYRSVQYSRAITIFDDDEQPVVTAQNITVTEADDTITAKITLQASAPISGEILYETVDGTAGRDDYSAATGSVTFNAQTTRTISIEIRGDDVTEAAESFAVRLYPSWGNFALATDSVTISIHDDDIGVGPRTMNIPTGDSRTASIQLGSVTPVDATFTLASSDPAGFTVPASVVMQAGTSSVNFDVTAIAPAHGGTVNVTFPASVGGGSATISVSTYIGATLTLTAPEGNAFPGQNVNVRASLSPAASTPVTVRLTSENVNIKIPQTIEIPAGGEATFDVKAQQPGFFTVVATLPAEYGNAQFYVNGRVLATPSKPALISIAPANGSVAGGTHVEARGFLLRSNCTISFGGIAGTSFSLTDVENASVMTPAHAAGTVDVTLQCGSDTSVLRNAFVYRNAGPSLTAVAPATGSTSGGTFVRVTGNDFAHSCWPAFGGVKSPEVTVVDDHTLFAVVPPHAAGAADVTLLCTGGDAQRAGAFTFVEAADPLAVIDTIEPSFAGPGEVVTIRGSHFRADDIVTFGGNVARVLESTPESHVVIVPELPAGAVTVLVDAPVSSFSAASIQGAAFLVGEASAPRVTGVSSSNVAVGAEVELTGTLLRTPYTLALGSHRVQIVSLLPWSAIVRLPSDIPAGDYTVAVLNASGNVATLGPVVHVRNEGLAIDRLSRRCGSTDGATEFDLVITGRSFIPEMTVHFGDALASWIIQSGNEMRVRVPANPAGASTITITSADGSVATRTNAFRYVSPFDPQPDCSEGRGRAVRH